MGCFNGTCCVSNLPIGAGTPVRYLLLTQNPFNTNPAAYACYIHGRWIPRTFPLKAKYNDYGGVEDVEEGPARDVWMEGFKEDLVERGVGDNSCHDSPVRKDMSLEQILEALWEGRVLVQPEKSISRSEMRKLMADLHGGPPKLHPGIPTMKRVRRAILKAGMTLSDGNFAKGYLVDLQRRGFVRVRWGDCEDREGNLVKLQPIFAKRFATMITVGTGNYGGPAEMILAPKPLPATTVPGYDTSFGRDFMPKKPLYVAQAMIREDVWQAFLA
jgi:hypothetical protein